MDVRNGNIVYSRDVSFEENAYPRLEFESDIAGVMTPTVRPMEPPQSTTETLPAEPTTVPSNTLPRFGHVPLENGQGQSPRIPSVKTNSLQQAAINRLRSMPPPSLGAALRQNKQTYSFITQQLTNLRRFKRNAHEVLATHQRRGKTRKPILPWQSRATSRSRRRHRRKRASRTHLHSPSHPLHHRAKTIPGSNDLT